jgi:methylated-DNA-[protein]-cysteine S-methyltransferase
MRAIVDFPDVAVTSVRYEAGEWGVGELLLAGERVVYHDLPRQDLAGGPLDRAPNRPQGTARLPGDSVLSASAPNGDGFATNLVTRLRRYFAGEAVDFGDVPLELDGLSGFHLDLVDALQAVPRGEVVTYGELAALAGRPGAARAAGTFCARNRFAVFVPCHRVVGAAGLGGYGSLGLDYKRRLLALEHVAL